MQSCLGWLILGWTVSHLLPLWPAKENTTRRYQYCIVGAGPSGLQLAQFMHTSRSSYAIIERSGVVGSFFERYPRHGKLISINKRFVDSANTEYAMRHDWNSLLTSGPGAKLLFRNYSQEMFPPKEAMLAYLRDYRLVNNLTVHFNTSVDNVSKTADGFLLATTGAFTGYYACQVVVMATGLPNLRPGEFPGHELTVGYDTVSVNSSHFENKRVLIIGKGNSGFETAQHVYGHTRLIHMMGRKPVRFAWSTHYVGDLRAVNNELLDTYQLKSLDGMFESENVRLSKNAYGEICAHPDEKEEESLASSDASFLSLHSAGHAWEGVKRFYCYDVAVRATGFVWDSRPTAGLNVTSVLRGKYPKVGENFESTDAPGIYFAGSMTHSLDFRASAGGFVHGFRYTARALHRILRARYHAESWPAAAAGPAAGLMDALLKRINEGSGTYQMFGYLGDVALLNHDRSSFTLLEEVPVRLLPQLGSVTGHPVHGPLLVFVFEYGRNFSGPRSDTFHEDRASCGAEDAATCNFLHPVLYYYDRLPSSNDQLGGKHALPKPDRLLHLMEDFYTNFHQTEHLLPMAGFLEAVLSQPAAGLSIEHCSLLALMSGQWPKFCCQQVGAGTVQGCWSASDMNLASG